MIGIIICLIGYLAGLVIHMLLFRYSKSARNWADNRGIEGPSGWTIGWPLYWIIYIAGKIIQLFFYSIKFCIDGEWKFKL